MARAARVIAANDLRRRLRDRTFYVQGIIAPIVMAAIIGFAFGGGFSLAATVGLVDADGSDLSRQLVAGMTAPGPEGSPVAFEAVDPAAVDTLIESGDIDSAIVLPPGFGAGVSGESPVPIDVVFDADKPITADVTRAVAGRIAARLDASRLAIAAGLASAGVAADSPAGRRIITEGTGVDVGADLDITAIGSGYQPLAYFGASMSMLFVFFTVGTGARSLITERREGTLQRLRAAPIGVPSILAGKAVGAILLGLASLCVVWAVTSVAFGARWGDPLAVLAVIVAVVLSVGGVGLAVTGLARSDAQADGFTSIVAFVLALLGGNFISPGRLPPVIERLSLLTPNGWALRSFTRIGAGGATVADVLPATGVMLAIGVVFGTVGVAVLQRRVRS